MKNLTAWTACPHPDGRMLSGRTIRIEKLNGDRHGSDLGAVLAGEERASLYDYLGDAPPKEASAVAQWAKRMEASSDPYFLAIIDQKTGQARGRFALMRINPTHGVIEVGHVLYSPELARSVQATEAQYLLMRHVFDDLGYRRFEWKCNALNRPSRNAARRLGFTYEGEFYQHMVVKGVNRDTAWFSILDSEWPARRRAFEAWLAPENFTQENKQKTALGIFMALFSAPSEDASVMARLRRANTQDVASLSAFQHEAYAVNQVITGRLPIPLTWDYAAVVRDFECWLFERDGRVDGALLLHKRANDLMLESIAVSPRARDHGLGDVLLRFAVRRAASHVGGTLRLLTNQLLTRNVDWYLARGLLIERIERSEDRTIVHFAKKIGRSEHER